MPDAVLRQADNNDIEGIGSVHALSWRAAYKSILPASLLADRTPEMVIERWRQNSTDKLDATLVAAMGDEILGFASWGPGRNEGLTDWGEIYAIYLHPDAYGKGLGLKLFHAVIDRLRKAGLSQAYVNVFEQNAQGRRFYEKMGGVLSERKPEDIVFGGVAYPEVTYLWPQLPVSRGDMSRR